MSEIQEALDAWLMAKEEHNETIDELNHAIDHLHKKDVLIHVLEGRCDAMADLLTQQSEVIEQCILDRSTQLNTIGILRVQVKELQQADPVRLAKVNEGLKKTIKRLKEKK